MALRLSVSSLITALALGSCSFANAAEAPKAPTKAPAKTVQTTAKATTAKKKAGAKKTANTAAGKTPSTPIETLANQARAAFWHGDIPGAIGAYQELIKEHPQARWYGELGNLYYQTGRPQLAAENYYLAAKALIATGRPLEAGALLPTLQRLDPQLAQKLLAQQSQPKEKHK